MQKLRCSPDPPAATSLRACSPAWRAIDPRTGHAVHCMHVRAHQALRHAARLPAITKVAARLLCARIQTASLAMCGMGCINVNMSTLLTSVLLRTHLQGRLLLHPSRAADPATDTYGDTRVQMMCLTVRHSHFSKHAALPTRARESPPVRVPVKTKFLKGIWLNLPTEHTVV